jgi:hypothetical protein
MMATFSRDRQINFKEAVILSKRKLAFFFLLAVGTLLLTACPSPISVSQINSDPARFKDKEVSIVGRVTDAYGLMGRGAYELDDGTGRIWVATAHGVPAKGSRVGVKGQVHSSLNIGGCAFGTILEETDRRVKGK